MVDHPHYVKFSDWREHFNYEDINDATCKLVIVTDDELEILRRSLKAASKRGNWEAEVSGDGYLTPSDEKWDEIEALIADLEEKLMSACDFVTLDDVNNRLGIGVAEPEGILHVHQALGGFIYWENTTINATPKIIVLGPTEGCNRGLSCMYTLVDKTNNNVFAASQTCYHNSTAVLWNAADCTITLAVDDNGEITVSRTAGTHDARLAIFIVWL